MHGAEPYMNQKVKMVKNCIYIKKIELIIEKGKMDELTGSFAKKPL